MQLSKQFGSLCLHKMHHKHSKVDVQLVQLHDGVAGGLFVEAVEFIEHIWFLLMFPYDL